MTDRRIRIPKIQSTVKGVGGRREEQKGHSRVLLPGSMLLWRLVDGGWEGKRQRSRLQQSTKGPPQQSPGGFVPSPIEPRRRR